MKEKGRFLKEYRGNRCLNCNVPLDVIDKYCHNCGQINSTKRLSFKDFFHEFLSSIFSYDSRLSRTILALLFRPGKISKDYVEGKRVIYANPFRFYLSVSIIFFIINGLFIDFEQFSANVEDDVNKSKASFEEIKQNISINDSIRQNISDQISNTKGISTADKEKIKTAILAIDTIPFPMDQKQKSKVSTYYSQSQIDSMSLYKKVTNLWTMYTDHYEKTGQKSAFHALTDLKHEKSSFNKYIYHRAIKTNNIDDNYGRELLEYIFNKLPFIIFFFLPFFALAIALLYVRKSFNYMEHLVFTFHTQTMFFILIGISILIDQITKNSTTLGITLLVFLFYLYKAMRKFYNQKRLKTIVKFMIVNILFFILAGIGSVITVIGSLLIF